MIALLAGCQSSSERSLKSYQRGRDLFQIAGSEEPKIKKIKIAREKKVVSTPLETEKKLDILPIQSNVHIRPKLLDLDHLDLKTDRETSIKKKLPVPKHRTLILNSKDVQYLLKKLGYYQGKLDGVIGSKSKAAIFKFQRDHGLLADGIAGKKTKAYLIDEVKAKYEREYLQLKRN